MYSTTENTAPSYALWLLTAWLPVALSGCATPTAKDVSSPYYAVPEGSVVTLQQRIEFPPGRARMFLQNGRVATGFDNYVPNCDLEIRKIDRQQAQYVEPGAFVVTRTQWLQTEDAQAAPLRLAALDIRLAGVGDSGLAMMYEGYRLRLENADQPNVMRLTCRGVYNDPAYARPPSIAEIRQALGDLAELTLADTAGAAIDLQKKNLVRRRRNLLI